MFSMGQHVMAQWTNGQWYGARIVQGNGAQYEVAWDDGSPNLWVGASQIQHDGGGAGIGMGGGGASFGIGQHVQAQWTNGQWFGARVVQSNGAQYEVAWDDGSPPLWLAPHQIQHDGGGAGIGMGGGGGAGFGIGQHVRAQWTNGQWYGARILQGNGAQFEVAWDDGSPPLWIGAHQIQHEGGAGMGGAGMGTPLGAGANMAIGYHVHAQYTDGQWYGARIAQVSGSQIEVAWDDGSPPQWLQMSQIRQG